METISPSRTFLGVRFVLFGFDPMNERQVRAKLIHGGGIDAGQYNKNCTHVIVDKIVYKDPICVAARNDRKILVTGLWVDHSYDVAMAVDVTSVMYRPLRDLNGIPGAKSLIICLTGYQRQDRDDIMTMVGLMGAQFSKPLVANKVTHLICYKFEGEKYELANKLKKIKLVNHRWLEDCLRDWELLPEDNYNKSGHELEMMEAEAKDSEDDADNINEKQSSLKMANKSPQLKAETPKSCQLSRSNREAPSMTHNLSEFEGLPSLMNVKNTSITPSRKNRDNHTPNVDTNYVSEVLACQEMRALNGASSVGLPDPQEGTPSSRKLGNDLESLLSSERPCSDGKFNAISYTSKTPRKSPSSIFSRESGNVRGSSKLEFGESIQISSAKDECTKDLTVSGHGEDLVKGCQQLHAEASSSKKQKLDVSCSKLGYQNMIGDADAQTSVTGSPSRNRKVPGQESEPLLHGPPKINNHSPLASHTCSINDAVNLDTAQKLNTDVSTDKSSELINKPARSPLFPETATPGVKQNESANIKTPVAYFKDLKESSSASKHAGGDLGVEKSEYEPSDAGSSGIQQQDKQVPSSCNWNSETGKFQTKANLEKLGQENDNMITEPGRKKTIAKKTLGSRPKLKSTANKKGSIYLNKAAAENDPAIGVSGNRADYKTASSANELEACDDTVNVIGGKELDARIGRKSGDNNESGTNYTDDETEAPEDKDGREDVFDLENVEMVYLPHEVHDKMESKPEGAQRAENNTSGDIEDDAREENSVACKDESACKASSVKGKVSRGRKQPLGKTKTNTVPPLSKQSKAVKKGEVKLHSTNRSKSRPVSGKNSESSMEVEKENKPIVDSDQNTSQAKNHVAKGVVKSDKGSTQTKQKSRKSKPVGTPSREVLKPVKTEPVWFILTGLKPQRKEFQQVIKHLKGKVCRDSHQWSYQATHFIAPEPIRRVEKFFAAAASGRWILKTDYLTACSQSGRFLEEEPYEWHKNGLSEDGAINLEAPRKWRLLREKTGHGAFYGMRIIIYGECIAPTLDTLKRVVKAGDGTILATSPPYDRFLTSGVDYAIISPGMPRVDVWVQEFIRHEIPCVVADYLVEYVCKPGYSLDRHVLYNTHAWAEKSFANLLSKAEEIVEDWIPSDDDNDIACEVCGSRDRGGVMLLCGNENGSIGCGVGMHIDCCDPPLKVEDIPEEDWFCPNCRNSNSKSSSKKRKGSSLKGK